MNKIKLVFWRPFLDSFLNYGDELGPYIIEKLFDGKVILKYKFINNRWDRYKTLIRYIMRLKIKEASMFLRSNERNILSIGSILKSGNEHSLIWGSGFMRDSELCNGGMVFAVRGYRTLELLNSQNVVIIGKPGIGDPAILLPVVYNKKITKKYEFGIIPHYSEYDDFVTLCNSECHLIDMRTKNIEATTDEILSCKKIISSSLHGLIVAHAYGIPALWAENSPLEPGTNGFKYSDYFSSVEIPIYAPIHNLKDMLLKKQNLDLLFREKSQYVLPIKNVKQIQDDLLMCAPFLLKDNYKIKKKIYE